MKITKVALAFVLITCGFSQELVAEPSARFTGNNTQVTLSSELVSALSTLGLTATATPGARLKNGVARFPVPVAEIDLQNASAEILHIGGLSLANESVTVELSQFIIDTTSSPLLTGLVKANGSIVGRIELFDITLPALGLPLPSAKRLKIEGASLSLTDSAADALNAAFSVSAFAEGIPVGSANITLNQAKKQKQS